MTHDYKTELNIKRQKDDDVVIALAGNPNVGKSTVFNYLTGLKQHTGNWPGKTVEVASGRCETVGGGRIIVDLPGCYSLMAHSPEEEVARDFICFGDADSVVVVADATCLERNLILVLQVLEVYDKAVLCLNLTDEAEKKGIHVDWRALSGILGIPVIPTSARSRRGLPSVRDTLSEGVPAREGGAYYIDYGEKIETAADKMEELIDSSCASHGGEWIGRLSKRWIALRLIDGDGELVEKLLSMTGVDREKREELVGELDMSRDEVSDHISREFVRRSEEIFASCVKYEERTALMRDMRLDRILTGRYTAVPVMILLLGTILWLSIVGANYPSMFLEWLFGVAGEGLRALLDASFIPAAVVSLLMDGVWRVTSWVVAVMLPPMAIFFPLFTLLEDFGYLPRIAFNLDPCFSRCSSCGKQALTMCMGIGCNAAGVTGTRIIDSPRERLCAILTNSFIPCNGRFPMLILLIAMLIPRGYSALTALGLLLVLLIGIGMTFLATYLLSHTLLKGKASAFTIELPPYRAPKIGETLVRSIFDRTLFVLGRAVAVAAPAGAVIWCLGNITVGGESFLVFVSGALDKVGSFIGMDGVILCAFIIGLPANEIVLPLAAMIYSSASSLTAIDDMSMTEIFLSNGWTVVTVVCTIIFCLMHWPCSTTLLTVKKETGSWGYTALAAALPTAFGVVCCIAVRFVMGVLV